MTFQNPEFIQDHEAWALVLIHFPGRVYGAQKCTGRSYLLEIRFLSDHDI